MFLKVIRNILLTFIDKIDSGNCNISLEELVSILKYLGTISEPNEFMSKQECCDYLGVSRATFDNHVRLGQIPQGFTKGGLLKFWNKIDIDIFIAQNNKL